LPLSSATFATSPTYRQIPDDVALIKLSISHLGDRECRKRTPEELAKLPPNMRAPMDCPRERSDINLEVDLDGEPVFAPCCTPPASTRTACRPSTSASKSRPAPPAGGQDERQPDQRRLQLRQGRSRSPLPRQVLVIDFNPDKVACSSSDRRHYANQLQTLPPAQVPAHRHAGEFHVNPFPELTSTMVKILQQVLRWLFMRVENVFNVAFGDKMNPFYHLGTISFWQFWLLIGSGLYLYIFADTGGA
jgi:hypothetical protein